MTCQEVMTSDPVCCVPEDAVSEVAKLMRAQDVGSVPVVDDHDGRRLIGMLTDRDLTVRVIAEGRDPAATQVRDVMSNNPVSCQGRRRLSGSLAGDGRAPAPPHSGG
jgi:CBS domain-containing protein